MIDSSRVSCKSAMRCLLIIHLEQQMRPHYISYLEFTELLCAALEHQPDIRNPCILPQYRAIGRSVIPIGIAPKWQKMGKPGLSSGMRAEC